MKIESFEQLQTLMNYGFTPEQIMNLSDDGTMPAADQKQEPAADQKQEPAADQKQEPAADQEQEPATDQKQEPEENPKVTALQAEVDNLKKQLQAANIKGASIDKIPADESSVENILAGIIRPEYNKEDNKK